METGFSEFDWMKYVHGLEGKMANFYPTPISKWG